MTGFGTTSVAIATAPTVISTFFSHIINRPKRKRSALRSKSGPALDERGPSDDITYKEGLEVVRRFIDFSSHHGIEEVQAFTAMAVPTPRTSLCVFRRVELMIKIG